MFSRFVTLFSLAALTVVVAATPTSYTCNSGSVHCCNQKFDNPIHCEKDETSIIDLLLGLGVDAGVQCSPINVIGALSDGAKCTQQAACCADVEQDGLVNLGCSPIAIPI